MKVYGSIEDVHDEKILKERIDSEQSRLFDAIEQMQDGVLLWDENQNLTFSNSHALQEMLKTQVLLAPGVAYF